MDIVKTIIKNTDPVVIAYEKEYSHLFLCFCSFVCIVKNKKLNLPNIFLLLLQEKLLREKKKTICDVEDDDIEFAMTCMLDIRKNFTKSIVAGIVGT